jgi:hypothetical protein
MKAYGGVDLFSSSLKAYLVIHSSHSLWLFAMLDLMKCGMDCPFKLHIKF